MCRFSVTAMDHGQRTIRDNNQQETVSKKTELIGTTKNSDREEAATRKVTIDKCIKILDHSSKCVNGNCPHKLCFQMKKAWKHFNTCRRRMAKSKKCEICKNMISLFNYHAKLCQDSLCHITQCREIKNSFKQWQTAQDAFLRNVIAFRMTHMPTVENK